VWEILILDIYSLKDNLVACEFVGLRVLHIFGLAWPNTTSEINKSQGSTRQAIAAVNERLAQRFSVEINLARIL
jgi:hypothetical protein